MKKFSGLTYTILGESIFKFIFMLSTNIVQLHFIKLVAPEIFTLSTTLSLALSTVFSSLVANKKVLSFVEKWFVVCMIADNLLFLAVTALSLEYPTVRYIGLAVINSTTVVLCYSAMSLFINRHFEGKPAEDLTLFNNKRGAYASWAGLAGSIIAIPLSSYISEALITVLVYSQVAGCGIWSVCDWKFYKGERRDV